MLSDSLSDSYIGIYNSILNYRDYVFQHSQELIKIMTEINILLAKLSEVSTSYERAEDIAKFDYNKAIRGIGYNDGEEWSNHHKYM